LVLEEARLEDKSLEELVGEALFKQLEVADLEAKAELHLRLCEKCVRGAGILEKRD
jgi:hypothetical protein